MRSLLISLLAVAACGGGSSGNPDIDAPVGGDDDAPSIDASIDSPPAPTTVTITGTATQQGIGGASPVAAATIAAFSNADKTTPVTMTTTDAQGNFTLMVTTNGVALDGFLKATKAGLVDTYLYPVDPISMDLAMVPVQMVTKQNFDFLHTLVGDAHQTGKGTLAMVVLDAAIPNGNPVAGATVTSTPAGTSVHYNGGNGLPSNSTTSTAVDGVGYVINVPPNVATTVGAAKGGSTFRDHTLETWPEALTTTLVTP